MYFRIIEEGYVGEDNRGNLPKNVGLPETIQSLLFKNFWGSQIYKSKSKYYILMHGLCLIASSVFSKSLHILMIATLKAAAYFVGDKDIPWLFGGD